MSYHNFFRTTATSGAAAVVIVDSNCTTKPVKVTKCFVTDTLPAGGVDHSSVVNVPATLSELGCIQAQTKQYMHDLMLRSKTIADIPNVTTTAPVPRQALCKLSIELDSVGSLPVPSCTLTADNMSLAMATSLALVLVSQAYEGRVYLGPMTRVKAPLYELIFENIPFETCFYLKKIICDILYNAPRNAKSRIPVTPHVEAIQQVRAANKELLAKYKQQQQQAREQMKRELAAKKELLKQQRADQRDLLKLYRVKQEIQTAAAASAMTSARAKVKKAAVEVPVLEIDDELADFLTHDPFLNCQEEKEDAVEVASHSSSSSSDESLDFSLLHNIEEEDLVDEAGVPYGEGF